MSVSCITCSAARKCSRSCVCASVCLFALHSCTVYDSYKPCFTCSAGRKCSRSRVRASVCLFALHSCTVYDSYKPLHHHVCIMFYMFHCGLLRTNVPGPVCASVCLSVCTSQLYCVWLIQTITSSCLYHVLHVLCCKEKFSLIDVWSSFSPYTNPLFSYVQECLQMITHSDPTIYQGVGDYS